MNVVDRRAEAERKYKESIERIDREEAILAPLAPIFEGYEKPSVFFANTKEAWITARWCRYKAIETGKQPDAALLRALLAAVPAVPLKLWRGTFMSIGRRDQEPDWRDLSKSRDIAPVVVEADPNWYSQYAKVGWRTESPHGALKIQVEFPLNAVRTLLQFTGNMRTDHLTGKPVDVLGQRWTTTPPAETLRWGSGSRETYGNAVTFWPDGKEPADYVTAILGDQS